MNGVELLSGRVVVFCFSSAGELDVMLPLLKIAGIEDFTVVAFKKEILEKVRQDTFYASLVRGRLESRIIGTISSSKPVRWMQFAASALRALWRYRRHDRFCLEFGHSGREKNVLLALLAFTGRAGKVLFYPHGHAVTADEAYAAGKWPRTTALCMKRGARIMKLGESSGQPGVVAVGYPILHSAWRDFVTHHVPQLYRDHVVILSRDAHPDYLREENRERMLAEVVEVLDECFPGAPIVLKAHPREVFPEGCLGNLAAPVEVSYENTYSVVRGARLAVSFWTSAFFQCQVLGVPVVEYHRPHERFNALYPRGSLNCAFVPRFESKPALREFAAALSGRAALHAR